LAWLPSNQELVADEAARAAGFRLRGFCSGGGQKMTGKIFLIRVLLFSFPFLMTMMRGDCVYGTSPTEGQSTRPTSAAGSTQQAATDVRGSWSGTFFSNDSNGGSFTITVVITPNSRGHLVGSSTLESECLKGAQLEVTVTGSEVVLAGSDKEGDNITVRGTLDSTGTLLESTYVLNGSATGGCETDNGAGTLVKR
jgi:hypothetical protein